MWSCPTRKRSYFDEDAALEALIQSKIDNQHSINEGAINVYECEFCNEWHLTSKGKVHPLLSEPETQERIKKGQIGKYWEDKYR